MKDFVKGRTTDEKFKSINQTLKHFSRRLREKIIGVMPTSPVFDFKFAPDADGVVLRRIFPARGKITKACVYIGKHEGKNLTLVYTSLMREGKSWIDEFEVGKEPLVFTLDINVEPGDRLEVSVEDPTKVKGVWIGFLYEVGLESLPKKDFMLDQLEEMEDDRENQEDV